MIDGLRRKAHGANVHGRVVGDFRRHELLQLLRQQGDHDRRGRDGRRPTTRRFWPSPLAAVAATFASFNRSPRYWHERLRLLRCFTHDRFPEAAFGVACVNSERSDARIIEKKRASRGDVRRHCWPACPDYSCPPEKDWAFNVSTGCTRVTVGRDDPAGRVTSSPCTSEERTAYRYAHVLLSNESAALPAGAPRLPCSPVPRC